MCVSGFSVLFYYILVSQNEHQYEAKYISFVLEVFGALPGAGATSGSEVTPTVPSGPSPDAAWGCFCCSAHMPLLCHVPDGGTPVCMAALPGSREGKKVAVGCLLLCLSSQCR